MAESVKQDYLARIDNLKQEYERAGEDGAFNAGREVGKLATEVASIAIGGAGVVKSGVNLTRNLTRKAIVSTKDVIARGGSVVSSSNGMLNKHYISLGNGVFEGPNGGKIINTGVKDSVTGNAIYQRVTAEGKLSNQFLMIDSQGKQLSVNRPDMLKNVKSATSIENGYPRSYLRKDTRRKIMEGYIQLDNGDYLGTKGNLIKGPIDIGHAYGWKHRRLSLAAKELNMTRKEFNDYVNSRPENFRLENMSRNRGHYDEMPGIDDVQRIKEDMQFFLKTGK